MKERPQDFLGFWLFYAERTVAYAFYEALKSCCVEHGKLYAITPPQWGALFLLYGDDGVTIGTLSQRLGFDAPTITGIVKRLEVSGLVERVHDHEDRRVVKVYLTEEARSIIPYLYEAAGNFNKALTRGFSEAEVQETITRLQRIVANLSAIGPGMGDRFGLLPEFFYQDQQAAEYPQNNQSVVLRVYP